MKNQSGRVTIFLLILLLAAVSLAVVTFKDKIKETVLSTTTSAQASLSFQPETLVLPPNGTAKIMVSTGAEQVAFAHVEINFDPNKVKLSQEISLTGSPLTRKVQVSTAAQANTSGKIIIALGLDPTALSAPSQSFSLGTIYLTPVTTSPNSTGSLTFSNIKIVNKNADIFTSFSTGLSLSLYPDTPPTAPSNLTGKAVSTSQVDLTWSASTDDKGVSGYKIYRNSTLLTTLTTTSYSDKSVSASSTYSYYVTAFDSSGNTSPRSNIVSVTTPDTVTPPPPTSTDTKAPTVNLTNPVNGMSVTRKSTIVLFANAFDEEGGSGMAKVEFYVNNALKCTDTTESYTCSYKLNAKPGASYTVIAKAYDKAGNVSSATATFTAK